MTSPLSRALGDNDPDEKSRYKVDPAARLAELLGHEQVAELDYMKYKWQHGYEILVYRLHNGGSMEYRGSYHPDGSCRTHELDEHVGSCSHDGVCIYCGKDVDVMTKESEDAVNLDELRDAYFKAVEDEQRAVEAVDAAARAWNLAREEVRDAFQEPSDDGYFWDDVELAAYLEDVEEAPTVVSNEQRYAEADYDDTEV